MCTFFPSYFNDWTVCNQTKKAFSPNTVQRMTILQTYDTVIVKYYFWYEFLMALSCLMTKWWTTPTFMTVWWLWWLVDKHIAMICNCFLADWYRRQKLLWNCYLAYEAALAQPTSRNSWPTNAFGRMIADELFIGIEANVTFKSHVLTTKTNSKTDFWCKYKNWNFSSKWNLFSSYNSITQRRSQATERRVNHL